MSANHPLKLAIMAAALLLLLGVVLAGCALTKLPNVSLKVTGDPATPPVLGPLADGGSVTDVAAWNDRRKPFLLKLFADNVYGRAPAIGAARVIERRTTMARAFDGAGKVEELIVGLGPQPDAPRFHMALMTPLASSAPVPVIIMENFCGNRAALRGLPNVAVPHSPVPSLCNNPFARPIVNLIFGKYADRPPFEKILRRGYAVAIFYGGDVVGDEPGIARTQLAGFDPGGPPEQAPGAVGAWAALYSRAIDLLSQEPAIDPKGMILWGHSRNGKAALWAAANDPRAAAVIALQSGTAGAALQKNGKGESIAQMTGSYPHWMAPAYAGFAGREGMLPLDQHMLLALLAPRPILIGLGRRDAWSDPEGSFLAARGATPAYQLLGAKGLAQDGMKDLNLNGELAVWMRGGLHGVHTSDWRVSLAFLDHWFKPAAAAQKTHRAA